jgi:hypothetical protein
MKEILLKVDSILKPIGYHKKGASFWKIENDVYKLIDFQKGAYRGNYFFINLCVHPIGLPKLQVKQLSIVDKPREYECLVRQRIEQVVQEERVAILTNGSESSTDNEHILALLDCLLKEADQWLNGWGRLDRLANATKDELINMLTVVPKLKEKAYFMLKCYCFIRLFEKDKAEKYLYQYLSFEIDGLDFSVLDNYLRSLLAEAKVTP